LDFKEFLRGEIRYRTLEKQHPEEAQRLFDLAEKDVQRKREIFKSMSETQKE
jgi:pyruvate-ferredoxin/flavodoxin oxidoreductase